MSTIALLQDLCYAMLLNVLRKRICTWTSRNSAHHKDCLKSSNKETMSFCRVLQGERGSALIVTEDAFKLLFKEINNDLQRLPTCTEWRASIYKGVDEFDNLQRMVIGFQLQDGYVKEKYRCIPE